MCASFKTCSEQLVVYTPCTIVEYGSTVKLESMDSIIPIFSAIPIKTMVNSTVEPAFHVSVRNLQDDVTQIRGPMKDRLNVVDTR